LSETDPRRTVKIAKLGGIAGGQKFEVHGSTCCSSVLFCSACLALAGWLSVLFLCSPLTSLFVVVIFKLAHDPPMDENHTAWLYGGETSNIELASKVSLLLRLLLRLSRAPRRSACLSIRISPSSSPCCFVVSQPRSVRRCALHVLLHDQPQPQNHCADAVCL